MGMKMKWIAWMNGIEWNYKKEKEKFIAPNGTTCDPCRQSIQIYVNLTGGYRL